MTTPKIRHGRLDDGYNIESTLQKLLLRVSEMVSCDHAGLVLRDPNTGELYIAAQCGMEADGETLARLISEERGIIYQVLNTGRPRLIANTSRVAGYVSLMRANGEEEAGAEHSRIAVPLFIDGEVGGALNLESRVPDSYSPADLRLLNPLMEIVAMTVKAAHHQRRLRDEHYELQEAYAALDERVQEIEQGVVERGSGNPQVEDLQQPLQRLHGVTESISNTFQQRKMLQAMADALVEEYGFERSVILLSQGEQLLAEAGAERGKEESKPSLRISIKDEAPRWAMFTINHRTLWCDRNSALGATLLQRLRLQSGILIPLVSRGKLIGVVVAGNSQPSAALTGGELQVFDILSDYLVKAVDNTRLFRETQQRTAEQEILYRTVNDIVNHRDLWQLLPVITQRAVKLLNAHSGAIYMHDRAHGRLEIVSSYNMIPDQTGSTLDIGEGLAGRVAANRRAMRVNDYTEWRGRAARFDGMQFGAVVGVPLSSKQGELIGVLDVVGKRGERIFDESDERLLSLFAGQASTVMETARLYTDLKVANERLAAVSKLKSEFLANVSHELRTPLNSIIGYSDVLLQGVYGDLSEKQTGALNKVQRNAKNLLQMINDVLDMSKIEAGRFELNNQAFSPREVVESALSMVETQAMQKALTLTHEVDSLLPRQLVGDQQRLQQVLLNLVANAVKFTDAGSIVVKLRLVNPELWAMVVKDSGIGLEQGDYQDIFDEFRQVDSSATRQHGGTGLGLAITRRLVNMMGGTVAVWSKGRGQGSTFTVTLPLVEPQAQRSIIEEAVWREETRRVGQVEWETARIMGNTLKLPSGDLRLAGVDEGSEGSANRAEELLLSEATLTPIADDAAAPPPVIETASRPLRVLSSLQTGELVRGSAAESDARPMLVMTPIQTGTLDANILDNWQINAETAIPQEGVKPIIVVDDDEDARDIISTMLRREGHTVVCASNLAEAAALINQATPSLVIIDLNVNDSSGLRLAAALRAVERTRKLPLVLLSASEPTSEERGQIQILVDYIVNKTGLATGELIDLVRVLNWQDTEETKE